SLVIQGQRASRSPLATFCPQLWRVGPSLSLLSPQLRCVAFYVLALLLLTATCVRANVSLPDVISSGMVLQQKQKALIWGQADPGEAVTVRFAGQSKKTIATPDGKCLVKLDSLRANSSPQTMIISGKNTIELTNILIGEVWLVAGQSNMQRLLSETANGEAAIPAADHPLIRLFNVSRQVAFQHAPP